MTSFQENLNRLANIGQEEDHAARKLRETIAKSKSLPYLFVGSGLSRRYLGLDDWLGLLQRFSDQIGVSFGRLRSEADNFPPLIASHLAAEFNKFWWEDASYVEQRRRWEHTVTGKDSALKVAVSEYISSIQDRFENSSTTQAAPLQRELEELSQVSIDGVITTNYDTLLERIFPSLKPYVGQSDLLFGAPQFIAELYKIHGSIEDPSSIILTNSDYDTFTIKGKYLAAKLLTIFTEHPVIFVGYSLSDQYLARIINDIATAIGPEREAVLASQLFFIEWNSDPESIPKIEATTIIRGDSNDVTIPITKISTHSFEWIWRSLKDLDRPYPAALLRQLREHIYDLVSSPSSDERFKKVRVVPFGENEADGLQVVYGVGRFSEEQVRNIEGIDTRAFTFDDLRDDILEIRELTMTPEWVLNIGIAQILRPQMNEYIPVHKYIRAYASSAVSYTGAHDGLDPKIEGLAKRDISASDGSFARFKREVDGILSSPLQVLEKFESLQFVADSILLLDQSQYRIEDLRNTLLKIIEGDLLTAANRTAFRKILSHYDRLRYASN